MRKLYKIVLVIIILTILTICNNSVIANVKIDELDTTSKSKLKSTKLGIGGGGALFEPAISPLDSNEMLVVPDMGGIYISHNQGIKWERKDLYGTVMSASYDPNRKGVIYAGGSGLYRSNDNGDTFELIFPKEDDIIARLTHNENGLQYYFTHSGIYDRNKFVKNILIDPEDSNHIFILCYSYKNGKVFESTDNGENFKEIFTYQKSAYNSSVQFDFNELIYRKETKDIFVINDEQIVRYNLDTKIKEVEYDSKLGIVDVSTVYENGKTYFVIIEKTDELENSDTKVYYTNNFVDKVDITKELTSVQSTTFHNNTYGDVTYKYNFAYISATSLDNIYITNWSYQKTSSIKKYPYTIDGIIRYHNGKAQYLYGNPFRDHNNLSSRAWCDGNTYSLGISASKKDEEEFLFTTLCGVYYSPDNTHIYPRYSTVTEGKYPNAKYVTSGIDEQVTYGVYENPFNRDNLLLLNTDLGLIRSEDNGKSWTLALNGIPSKWTNTVYDVAFDERRENYVYSLWSGRHNVPYSAKNETDGRYGGFAISKDAGKTWDATYSSGLPENTIPVKMSVVYPENSEEVTIYVATFNEGFFVSYDSGKTFTEMNKGLNRIAYKEEEKYKYIFAADIEVKEGHIFGMTAKTSYNGETQPGELYEYIDGKWQNIPLPKNVKTPRDIYYHNGILYISGVPTPVWEYKNGTDFTNYGGGVYSYENGKFTQIFDERISTTSVQIDSKGTIYISDIDGNIYRKEKNKDYQKIYDSYFYISRGLQLSSDDDYLYLATLGGGLLKLENLNSLYDFTNIVFADSNMYSKICEELGDKIIEKNDSEKSILLSSEDINSITKLKLNNSNISKIDGIEKFTALKDLNISNNGITDISSLSSLKNLTSLSAYGNTISNLSPISNLNKLEYLNISKNRLIDNTENSVTNSISKLTNLTQLDISHNYLKYINGLSSLTNLKKLNLYDNGICNLTGLGTLTNLTSLNLGENNENGKDNGVKGLENLEKLTKLEEFNFSENKTPEILNHITKLTNLKKLSLQRNKIRNISSLGNLTNLEVLNLYYNEIETIPQELSKLANLKELILGNNWLYDITGFYKDETINFKKLQKLDLSKNEAIETMYENEKNDGWTKRVENNLKIMALLQKDINELNDENITDTSSLPHYDKNGIAYVTYDDFGARCDGIYDDFIAIRNAHLFANKKDCEVRATKGKTYHIFKYYEEAVIVKTNVDWQNATFIIHDEKIEEVSGRYQGLFRFTNGKDETIINNPTWTIGKETKSIPEITSTLEKLNEKGYQRYLCAAINADKKQYIRYGGNANSGDNQQDYFVVDNKGNVLNDIQWDFEKITTFTIYPISNTSLNIKNGNFITNAVESQSETPYTRSGSGKPIYFTRNIYVTKSTNVNISGINHKLSYELDKDELSGSYAGFINTNVVADIEISNCSLFARKYGVEGRSTYDLSLGANVNVKCKNITSNNITDLDRYGIICSLFCKDVSYENCKLNRIDAHQGIYNLTVKNCHIGSKGLTMTGQGTLNVIGTTIESDTFITLRWDYGSTWTGDVNIIDCTYKYNGIWAPKLINVSLSYDNNELHNFGYDCTMPNINVHNFTIDMNNTEKPCFYIMSLNNMKLEEPYLENTKKYLEKYLPDNINFNQYKFINTANDIKLEIANTNGNGNLETYLNKYSYVISDISLTENGNDENLIKQIDFYGKSKFDKPLKLEVKKNSLTQNNISIYKDGQAIIENQPINDKYTYSFDKNGKYRIEVSSLEKKNQYEGNKIYEFTLNIEEPVEDDKQIIALETDKEQVKQGEEVNLLIKLNNDKINVFKAKIKYDNSVFEDLNQNSFTTKGNWEGLKYNEKSKEFILINKQETEKEDILEIKFKAKKDAELGQTEIRIEDITVSSETQEVQEKDLSQKIEVIEVSDTPIVPDKPDEPDTPDTPVVPDKPDEPDTPDTPVIPDKPDEPDTPDTPVIPDKPDEPDTPNTSNISNTTNTLTNIQIENEENLPDELPNTGKSDTVIIVVITVATVSVVILIFKYKKIRKIMMIFLICGVLIRSENILATEKIFLGDINNNSMIDDTDIEILEEHLINLKSLEEQQKVDMNKDNVISIIDLSLLIKQQKECPYDKYNVTNISQWTPVPIVSEELLEKEEVTTGGEGCQWPIGMDISKDGKLLLYGTDVGGVYRSVDGGKNWEQSNAGLASRGVGAFSIDPTNLSFVIAEGINSGPSDRNGLYISENGGVSWKQTKSMLITGHRDIRDSILFDESSYDKNKNRCMTAYWSTPYKTEKNDLKEEEKGLYKSTDGGYTWKLINSDLCDGTIKINPYTGDVYVSKSDGIYYSNDKGINFTKIVDAEIAGLDLVSTNNKKVYVYYCNKTGLYKSEDGKNFEKFISESFPTKNPKHIKVSPVDTNKMLVINKEGEYRNFPYYSEDGGVTWKKSELNNELSMMPYNNRASIPMWSTTQNKVWLFVQGDFVSSSIDGGKTFKWDSNGITGILCGGNIHYNVYNPDLIYFGSQDYNGCVTTNGGKTWKYVNMSESKWGGFCYGGYAVDENTYYVGVSEGGKNSNPRKLKITFDGGKTVIDTGMYFTQKNLRASIESSYQSPTNPEVLFACDLRSDDGGHTWKKMDGCINVYTHNPKGKKELYGMDETAQYVVVSYDEGVTWTKVNNEAFIPNPNFPALKIDDVAYDWKNESVYVAAGWGYLYRVSVKTGEAEFVLNKYLDRYKNAPINALGTYVITKVEVDPNDPNIIYCGGAGNSYLNNCSLYRSVDGGKTFQVMTSNTSNSIVKKGKQGGFETNSIEVNPKTGELLFSGGCFGISKLSPPYQIMNKLKKN